MQGKLYLVGIGPGSREHTTRRAVEAIRESDVVVGYTTYLRLVEDLLSGKEVLASGMRREVERARQAVELALGGKKVAIVSSGDSGIYGMASAVFEYLAENRLELEVEVVPGVTSALAAAALLGAPLGNDFAVISLSDLLVPWQEIERRVELAAEGDFVIVLYNPRSSRRDWQLGRVREIVLEHRPQATPVGLVRNAYRDGCAVEVTTLREMNPAKADMLTTLIIGSSRSFVYAGRIITPRGYRSKYSMRG
ncbi:MAG: precorrin-3B C(17)-methyltransferase [Euryarchaeota archaeon]|nr:precorrin-3B C(17)-methyltransferase [Euryarchaeota archaeon]